MRTASNEELASHAEMEAEVRRSSEVAVEFWRDPGEDLDFLYGPQRIPMRYREVSRVLVQVRGPIGWQSGPTGMRVFWADAQNPHQLRAVVSDSSDLLVWLGLVLPEGFQAPTGR